MTTAHLFIGGPLDGQKVEVADGMNVFRAKEPTPAPVALPSLADMIEQESVKIHSYIREQFIVARGEKQAVFIHEDAHKNVCAMKLLFDGYAPRLIEAVRRISTIPGNVEIVIPHSAKSLVQIRMPFGGQVIAKGSTLEEALIALAEL